MANRYADRPYAVGKGKPPVATRFPPGHKPSKKAGRPKGAKSISSLRKQLDELVEMPGKDGKMVKVPLEQALDRRLIQMAIQEGNLRAAELIKKLIALDRSADDADEDRETLENKKKLTAKLAEGLALIASLKRSGLLETVNGCLEPSSWAVEMAMLRQQQGAEDSGKEAGEAKPG